MARYRIYPSKNSVIFEDDQDRNVGLNPVFELWYGVSGVTRAVFKWDWSDYYADFLAGKVPALTDASLTNFHAEFTAVAPIQQADNAVGFAEYELECPDLDNAHQIIDFEEGIGWWHEGPDIVTGFTNWVNATAAQAWPEIGAAPNGTLKATATADRDPGQLVFTCANVDGAADKVWNQHVVPDQYLVTVLKYTDAYESLTGTTPGQKRLIFSRHTNTLFTPYQQVDWDDQVLSDRSSAIETTEHDLYLFLYKNGVLTDPTSVDSVEINSVTITTGISKVSTGIYKYTYLVPAGLDPSNTGTTLTDTWTITQSNGLQVTVANEFTVRNAAYAGDWSGDTALAAQPYQVSLPNLQDEYTKGDEACIRVLFRPEFSSNYSVLRNAEFRIHIPDKTTSEPALVMYDWSPISYRVESDGTGDNFFLLQTGWFLTGQTYEVNIRYSDGASTTTDVIKRTFKVVT